MARFGINDIEQSGKGVTYEKVPTAQDVIDKGGNPLGALGQAVTNLVDPSVSNGMRKKVTPATAASDFESQQTAKMQENLGSLPNAVGVPLKVDVPAAQAYAANTYKPVLGGSPPVPQMAPSHTPAAAQPSASTAVPASVSTPTLPNGVKNWTLGKTGAPVTASAAMGNLSDQSAGGVNSNRAMVDNGLNIKPSSFTGYSSQARTDELGRPMADRQITSDLGMMTNRGMAGRTYDEQVAFANKVNADSARQLATQMSPKEAAEAMIAKDTNRSEVTRANAAAGAANAKARLGAYNTMQAQNTELAKSQNASAASKYTADQHLLGTKATADAHVKSADLTADGREAATVAKNKADVQEKTQKDYAASVKGYTDHWSKLNLPKEYVPKLAQYAKIYTEAQDPKGNVFMMAPNRDGGMYAALPKAYEAQYQKLLQTMPHKEAAARIYQVAKNAGHAVDVPDFNRFMPTTEAIKAQNNNAQLGAA